MHLARSSQCTNKEGCHSYDVDGNKFIDYVMGCQPLILGYSIKM